MLAQRVAQVFQPCLMRVPLRGVLPHRDTRDWRRVQERRARRRFPVMPEHIGGSNTRFVIVTGEGCD
jgi:hypothetical protein